MTKGAKRALPRADGLDATWKEGIVCGVMSRGVEKIQCACAVAGFLHYPHLGLQRHWDDGKVRYGVRPAALRVRDPDGTCSSARNSRGYVLCTG